MNRKNIVSGLVLLLATLSTLTISQAQEIRETQVTIYSDEISETSPGLARSTVKEIRSLNLQEGINQIRLTDVPQLIDTSTVHFRSLRDPRGTNVVEQNFEYDLVSGEKVMQRYLNQPITLYDEQGQPISGKLLTFDNVRIVLRSEDDHKVQLVNSNEYVKMITLEDQQDGLVVTPTLNWVIDAQEAGAHDVEVMYQTTGLGWHSDYTMILNEDDTSMDLSSWVTITNTSGRAYTDAMLKLVASDVSTTTTTPVYGEYYNDPYNQGYGGYGVEPLRQQGFFDYHLYTLERPVQIQNNVSKQVELFASVEGIPINKVFVFEGSNQTYYNYGYAYTDQYYGTPNDKVHTYLELANTQQVGLGRPLPAGRVFVYKVDKGSKDVEFIGVDRFTHTEPAEQIRLRMGSAVDVTGEWKQSSFNVDWNNTTMDESFEITLRNQTQAPIKVLVVEHLYRWTNWHINKKSHDYVNQDAQTINFRVDVPKNGTTKLTYSVKYDW